ncbi:MAG: amidohydrolase family protein [Gammaproteobacteria bacterium]
MQEPLYDRIPVIDIDSHVTEPPDVWTSRVDPRWGAGIPHVETIRGRNTWVADGGRYTYDPGSNCLAGYDGTLPGPASYEEMMPAAWQPDARLRLLDELGIHAQVLYPNVGGFGAGFWVRMSDRELALACVRAYNDFITEFASADPRRLLPITSLPFWDVEASVAEVERCVKKGHRGLNFCTAPQDFGLPPIFHRHWDPIYARAEEAGVPVNFHIGGGDILGQFRDVPEGMSTLGNAARVSAMLFMDNARCIADLIMGGVCQRFPRLNLVSVESGAGYLPFLLEALDWQFENLGADRDTGFDRLPSEYFRRQIHGSFWFERGAMSAALDAFADNLMLETDIPHIVCQYPGTSAPKAVGPRRYAEEVLGALPAQVQRKVLFENAARLYGVADPAAAAAR